MDTHNGHIGIAVGHGYKGHIWPKWPKWLRGIMGPHELYCCTAVSGVLHDSVAVAVQGVLL